MQQTERHNLAGRVIRDPFHTGDCGLTVESGKQEYVVRAPSDTAMLFTLAARSRAPLPELYPRLTFLAIAFVLLISALTAEVEYLRVAGYSWP